MTITFHESDLGSSLNNDQTNFIVSCINVNPLITEQVGKLVQEAAEAGKLMEQMFWLDSERVMDEKERQKNEL